MVLPEDDANRQVANGFHIEIDNIRQFQVLPIAGGWQHVLEQFVTTQAPAMRRWPFRSMILILDFDNQFEDRRQLFQREIPTDLVNRTFLLGALTEPEQLRRMLGKYEGIGSQLARNCRDGTETAWQHQLLRHNLEEIGRMRPTIRPILFREP